jgi:hypothetical protein
VELFTCKKNGLQGVFDHKGNQILPLDYQSIKVYGWHNIIQQNGKFGLFDKYKRKITIPCEYDEIDDKSPSGSILICKKNEKKGAFIRDKEFIPCIYDEIIEEHSNRQYRYVAKKGNQTTIFTYPLDCE